LAITDHDSVGGIEEGRAAAKAHGMRLINGVEMSTSFEGRSLHILAYNFSREEPQLLQMLDRLARAREDRNQMMVERLCSLGLELTLEEIAEHADEKVGRPHFAKAMVARGYVKTTEEAFEKWIGDKKPGYVVQELVTPKAAIEAVHAAGGIAVLAHPLTYGRDPSQVESLLTTLTGVGLDGVEVYYAASSPGEIRMLQHFADRFRLIATVGSDFHYEPGLPLPVAPPRIVERLLEIFSERRP